ncbi:protein phosphatase regulator REG1 [Paracoccidioides brasiliensis Pb18]|uniref:Nitrogen regulatory protein areA GATA-like domain-containing protein n=1 Tax=Paracoccidioides brasiliensis (strain Pb18) TaxID=502780 RepID=C1FZI0_PARBD|nr:protein phosphatase regulator REG1 [Paracoccidioides brasiliensis Pb18]EEH43731.1 hypothetical protein PADG_00020 [Paracoccidioides brasiliensis Pb18]
MTTLLPALPERDVLSSPEPHRRKRDNPSFLKSQCQYRKSPEVECYPVHTSSISSPSSTGQSSPIFSSVFFHSSPPSITLPPTPEEPEDDEIVFPSYDAASCGEEDDKASVDSALFSPNSPTTDQWRCDSVMPLVVGDDASIKDEPTRHVDYLSHDWKEEDIWSSWRYIVSKRDEYNNGMRLENAAWRTWAKAKHRLGTVTPESLNWLKDCDVTWLYGPLQTSSKLSPSVSSPPPTRLSTSGSFLHKKPILKKRTASQAILQRSITTRTLLSHAGAILKAREADSSRGRPGLGRSASDYVLPQTYFENSSRSTMSPGTETPSDRRHISFNDEVSQCIAVEGKDDYYDDMDYSTIVDDDMLSEDGVLMMREMPPRPRLSNQSTPRSSFSSDSKTIAPLPPTTLKYRRDTPEPDVQAPVRSSPYSWWPLPVPRLSHSASTETLRPPKHQQWQQVHENFLLDDRDDEGDDDDDATVTSDMDVKWHLPGRKMGEDELPAYNGLWFSSDSSKHQQQNSNDYHNHNDHNNNRESYFSSSDRLFPFDYDELYDIDDATSRNDEGEGEHMKFGFIGKVVDTVNTAKDIAHVIWNVGWGS